MQENVWIWSFCAEKGTAKNTLQFKIFKRGMDHIVWTVTGKPPDYLEYASSLHKNLQFTLETPNGNEDLGFLDLNMKLNDEKNLLSLVSKIEWYRNNPKFL